jgi:hypothetical protein
VSTVSRCSMLQEVFVALFGVLYETWHEIGWRHDKIKYTHSSNTSINTSKKHPLGVYRCVRWMYILYFTMEHIGTNKVKLKRRHDTLIRIAISLLRFESVPPENEVGLVVIRPLRLVLIENSSVVHCWIKLRRVHCSKIDALLHASDLFTNLTMRIKH